MKLYYTNPTAEGQIQADPRLSLGGYRALSPLPNDAFDNLFSEISQFMLSKDTPEDEYVGLILKNETGVAVENLWLWFDYGTDPYSKLLVAAVDLVADANGKLYMEHIPNRNSKPLYADFYEADGIDNAVALGDIEIDGAVGLWISRQLVSGLASSVQADGNLYEVDPDNADLVIAKIPVKQDSISIQMLWGYYGRPIGSELI